MHENIKGFVIISLWTLMTQDFIITFGRCRDVPDLELFTIHKHLFFLKND